MAVVNNPTGQGGHYDAVAATGNGGAQTAAAPSPSDPRPIPSSDRVSPPEEPEAVPSAEGDDGDNVQLRRYVAEVSASAEAVDQLQRSGNLDLAPVVAEAAQEWANDREEEEDNNEEEAVEAAEEVTAHVEAANSMVSSDCENVIESDKAKDKGDTDSVRVNFKPEEENLQTSQSSTSEAQLHSAQTSNLTSSPCEVSLQEVPISPETGESRGTSVQEELTSSDIQV